MEESLKVLQDAINETDRLAKFVNRKINTQVQAQGEREIIMASVYTWTKNHRPCFSVWDSSQSLTSLDKCYSTLLEYSAKNTSRIKYKKIFKELKNKLVNFRTEIFNDPKLKIDKSTVSMPDFSHLVSDEKMQSILCRRWNEIINCLHNDKPAPLSATIMMGGVLEALFIARINKLSDKRPIFKLKAVPKNKKTGTPLPFSDWTLNDYIEVATEMTWIGKPARDIGKVLRDYRNLIHPERELSSGIVIEMQDAQMFLPIFTQLANQIVLSAK